MFSQKILAFETSCNFLLFGRRIGEIFSLVQDNEEYFSASNWKHFLCQSSMFGNKAEPGVNILLRVPNMIHTGEKFHLCQLCVKGSERKKHGLSCTGEKLHICMTCGKGCM